MSCIELDNGHIRVHILPAAGGGLLSFDAMHQGKWEPVMRPGTEVDALREPNTLACYPLLPWSNRIAHGRFSMWGVPMTVAQTRADEPYPLHGDGWLSHWTVSEQSAHIVELLLVSRRTAPFCYEARLRYEIDGMALKIVLSVHNLGRILPFGLGLHPFFPRSADLKLEAPATGMWRSAPDHLPVALEAIAADASFNVPQSLDAEGEINHSFEGWNGRARIHWPQRGLAVSISADTSRYVLYAPMANDFFCLEPVDHAVNAHNLPGSWKERGLTVLATGERLQRHYQFLVSIEQ